MSKFVVVNGEFRLCIANFVPEKGRDKSMVPFVKPCDEDGDEIKFSKGFSPAKLKALLMSENRQAIIDLCDQAIAQAEAANGVATAKAAKVAPQPPAASQVVYYTFDGANQSEAIIDVTKVRAFVAANQGNPGAQIHVNGAWHTKDQWAALGFAPPPAPPAPPAAPVAPPAPSTPAAPAVDAPKVGGALASLVAKKQAAQA